MRTLLASADPHAREAVDLFVYRIRRELGSMVAALGGLDALVFTGGIGEHASGDSRAGVRRRGVAGDRSSTPAPTTAANAHLVRDVAHSGVPGPQR